MLRTLAFILATGAFATALPSCKQGLGDICQVNSDCESGKCSNVLNQPVQHCVNSETQNPPDANGTGADAEVVDAEPIDAMIVDAGPPDAL